MSENAAPRRARSRALIAIAVVAALAAALGVGFWLRSALGEVPPTDAAADPVVVLEAAAAPGEAPFTTSVVAPEHSPDAVLTETIVARTVEIIEQAASDATGAPAVTGTAPGLYGGSGELGACDPQALVAFFADEEGKAAAWAGVLGIAPSTISTFVAGLTSVVLTADTLVTNHGFAADGAATARQSVLQAGTAILVDPRGLPVVRCACGNPLLPPQVTGATADAETLGTPWDGLDLERVVSISAAPDDVVSFTVADLVTGDLIDVPAGASGSAGLYLATTSNHAQVTMEPEPLAGSIRTSPDGADWTVALETTPMLDIATGADLAVAVGLDEEYGGAIHTSTDGLDWTPAIQVIDPLTAVAYGDGTWVAVGNRSFAEESGEGDGSSGAIYRSDDGVAWQRVATTDPYENADLASNGELRYQSMTSVGYGEGRWIATATECAYRTCMRVIFTSPDAQTWTRMALDEQIVLIDLAHNGEEWAFVGGEPIPNPANNAEIDYPIGTAGTSPDGLTWSIGPTSPDRVVLTGLNPGDGEWLAVDAYVPSTPSDPPPAGGIYRSTDVLSWEQIGTAGPWTTSVALLHPGPAATTPPEDAVDPEVGTVRIRTEGLELLAPDGATLQNLSYDTTPAATVIEAVTGALGAGSSEFVGGDGICSEDSTVTAWGGLRLVHPGTEPTAVSWWVILDGPGGPAGAAAVDGPGGVTLGQDVDAVRSANPDAPNEAFSYEGVTYDYVYLDVVAHQDEGTPYELAVSVGAEDGVVTHLQAPAYVEGDC